MTTMTPELQRVLDNFALLPEVQAQGGVASPAYRGLEAAVNSSPVLVEQLNQAVQQRHVQKFAVLTDPHAGASYDSGTVNLGLNRLSASADPANTDVRADLVFQLGHEVQHGFHAVQTQQGYDTFQQSIAAVSQSSAQQHNYTAAIGGILSVNRRDEASAEVAGWNALISHVKQSNPNPTLKDMHDKSSYMADFIDVNQNVTPDLYTLKPGLTLNPDMTMSMTQGNIQAMGQHYFNASPDATGIGAHGNSDYTNYYAAYHVGQACRVEQRSVQPHSKLLIDMGALKLDERLLEQNGIYLDNPLARCAYYDTAHPTVQRHFDHTHDGAHQNTHVPVYEYAPPAPSQGLDTLPPSNRTEPLSQNHAVLSQPLAANASVREVGQYALAALLSDDDNAMHAALEQVFQTDVAKESMQQAQQVVMAYDNQQAQIQQMDNPVLVMTM